jgi:hypothetical protein
MSSFMSTSKTLAMFTSVSREGWQRIFLLLFPRFFVTLRQKSRRYSVSAKKRTSFFCFALNFSYLCRQSRDKELRLSGMNIQKKQYNTLIIRELLPPPISSCRVSKLLHLYFSQHNPCCIRHTPLVAGLLCVFIS